jgi:hypothetical protein
MRSALLLLAGFLFFAIACKSSPEKPSQNAEPIEASEARPEPKPWTTTFLTPAVLIAREVRIEGPLGIRDHVALTVDSELHEYSLKTGPDGLLQELTFKQGQGEGELRCQLDQLVIAAEQRITVLERPGPAPVVVVATGEALWQTPAGEERRGDSLRLVGEEPK